MSRSKIINLMLVLILFNTQFAPLAYAQANNPADPNPIDPNLPPNFTPSDPNAVTDPNATAPPTDPAAQNPNPSTGQPAPYRGGFTCSSTTMDPKERQKFWDETLNKGFVGKELSSGTPAKKNRESVDQNIVILPDEKDNLAVKQKIPNQKIDPEEIVHRLNKYNQGPFAFGLLLSDSLRVGRCVDINASCALLGKSLQLRNSASGIVANVKNVFKDMVTWAKPDDEKYSPAGLSDEEAANIKAELIQVAGDNNKFDFQTASRVQKALIPNSILTTTFSSSMNSNCTNPACYINSYSMFDKMFNAYVSTDMLIGSFGPSLFNATKRAMSWAGSRQPWFKIADTAFATRLRSLYNKPGSAFHNFIKNRQYRRVQQVGVPLDNEIAAKRWVLAGGGFNANWKPAIDKFITPNHTTKESKGVLFDYLADQRRLARGYNVETRLAKEELANATRGLAPDDPAFIQAKIKAAGRMGLLYHNIDDDTGIDAVEYIFQHKSINWQRYAVKRGDTDEFVSPAVDSDFADIFFQKLHDSGNFNFVPTDAAKYKTTLAHVGDNLALYAPSPKGDAITSVTRNTIEDAAAQGSFAQAFAKLDDETFVPFNKQNTQYILKKTAGDVQLFRGGYEKVREVSPEEMADLITGPRVGWRTEAWSRNSETMLNWAKANNYQLRKNYATWLDKQLAYEDNILKSYFATKEGALKWTALPFAFWGAKRGFGSEDLSLYQLPDSWKTMEVGLGETQLYNDAFIDFFANEGSDQGDVFVAFLNKLPWKMVLNKISENFNPVNDLFTAITNNELRNETGNLVTFVSGPNDCPGCGLSLATKNLKTFQPFFYAPTKLNTYILEDTPGDQQEIGQTLIAYTRHTNIKGETKDFENSNGIDLEEAIRTKETCEEKVKALNGNIPLLGSVLPTDAKIGGVLAFGENIGYGIFTWAGFLGSTVQQVLIAPQLQDCVDAQEGYFIHFFAPAAKKEKGSESKGETGTQKVSELVADGTDRVMAALQGRDLTNKLPNGAMSSDANSYTQDAMDDLRNQIDELVQNAETKDLVEALVQTEGINTGQFTGSHLFYLWTKDFESNVSKYRTEGKEVITDGNISVENNFKDGKVRVNGQDVITDPDIARLASESLAGPFMGYPNTLTKIGLPTDSNEVIFSMDYRGETVVLNSEVLDCIRAGVLAQSGVGMDSDNLSEVFGKTLAIVTDTHPNVHPDESNRQIVAEGVPRKVATSESAKADVLASTLTLITPVVGGTPDVGRMTSIQFQNGVIVYKPETNELLVWLKHNQKAILNQNDVAGLHATKTTSKNPITDCDEPAIDLDVEGNPNSEQSMYKAQLFNDSLDQKGPFKIFDTPSKRFIFYSKLESGACQDYFKVIDKATGEVLVDQPIKSIEQTPTGVKVTTADGKDHTLDFSSENGRPILTYNGQPETLVSAQGENGAFWYDPEKGLWYSENAQLLPLLDAFKKNGISTQVGPDGRVTSQASGNVLNLNVGGQGGGFNLPSLPENPFFLAGFILLILGAILNIRKRVL